MLAERIIYFLLIIYFYKHPIHTLGTEYFTTLKPLNSNLDLSVANRAEGNRVSVWQLSSAVAPALTCTCCPWQGDKACPNTQHCFCWPWMLLTQPLTCTVTQQETAVQAYKWLLDHSQGLEIWVQKEWSDRFHMQYNWALEIWVY